MMKAADLTASLLAPPRQFRPVSFWFLNHFLEEGELRRQIAEQDEKGFGGVMCHARDGLRTAYLEQEWEDAMRVIIDECEKRGMHVWLYDENHYPSGIAGGKIPKRFPGRTMLSLVPALEREVGTGEGIRIQGSGFGSDRENGDDRGPRGSTDRPPVSSPLLLAGLRYLLATGTRTGKTHDLLPRVHDGCLDWANDLGEPAMLLALVERGYETNPVNHPDFSFYPDYLDEEVCRGFIEETHEWYAKRFRDHFGKTIRGIFTDNACAHFGHIRRCVPWSRSLDRRFTAATGLAIEEILPKLLHPLPGYRAARLRFWRFFGDEFIRTFVGAINDWCKARRLYSTGHYCLEDGMGEHVRQIGSYFDVMRNQNLNAVDQISTRAPETSLWGIEGGEPLTACIRNTASAALFNGSPRVMCESFGCCGGWGFDLREMRRIGGHLAALGVDLFVPHGLYYSIAGTRKYECIPDHLHNPMWGDVDGRIGFAGRDCGPVSGHHAAGDDCPGRDRGGVGFPEAGRERWRRQPACRPRRPARFRPWRGCRARSRSLRWTPRPALATARQLRNRGRGHSSGRTGGERRHAGCPGARREVPLPVQGHRPSGRPGPRSREPGPVGHVCGSGWRGRLSGSRSLGGL
jgi:hypothetical protein